MSRLSMSFVCGSCGHHPACHDWHEDGHGHQGCGHVDCSCGLAFSDVAATAVDQIANARVKAALEAAAAAVRDRKLPSPERGTPGRLERAVYDDAARIVRAAADTT